MDNQIMGGQNAIDPGRIGEVPTELQRLARAVEVLGELVENLQQRISPALRNIPESPNKEATLRQQEPSTQVGQEIYKQVNNIEAISSRITGMTNRVEL